MASFIELLQWPVVTIPLLAAWFTGSVRAPTPYHCFESHLLSHTRMMVSSRILLQSGIIGLFPQDLAKDERERTKHSRSLAHGGMGHPHSKATGTPHIEHTRDDHR